MTVTATNAYSGPFTGNGATTAFPFTFQVSATDEAYLEVDGAEVGSMITLTTVAGIIVGGTATADTAPATDAIVYVRSRPTFEQNIALTNNGPFSASVIGEGFDRRRGSLAPRGHRAGGSVIRLRSPIPRQLRPIRPLCRRRDRQRPLRHDRSGHRSHDRRAIFPRHRLRHDLRRALQERRHRRDGPGAFHPFVRPARPLHRDRHPWLNHADHHHLRLRLRLWQRLHDGRGRASHLRLDPP
jgi:hypothetical protein